MKPGFVITGRASVESRDWGFVKAHDNGIAMHGFPNHGRFSTAAGGSSRITNPRSKQSGLTLLEVIVAFALLGLALTLLLGSLSGAVRQVRGAEEAGRAALHAQSLLAQAGVGVPLLPGISEGEWDGGRYRWRLQVSPYIDPLRPQSAMTVPNAPRLLQLQLDVRWGEAVGQSLQVRSLRQVAGGQAAP